MKFRFLGNTGLRVSELCLGAMTFGKGFYGIGEVEQAGSTALVKRALDAGINFFDTADIYCRGQSEQILGQAFSDLGVNRDEIVIATKVRGPMSDAASEGTGDMNNVGPLAQAYRRFVRGEPQAAGHRPHRPLPNSRLGRAHAARRDHARTRRAGSRWQGALHRLLESRGLANRQSERRRQGKQRRHVLLVASLLFAGRPRSRARFAADVSA